MARLQEKYKKEILPMLKEELGVKSENKHKHIEFDNTWGYN